MSRTRRRTSADLTILGRGRPVFLDQPRVVPGPDATNLLHRDLVPPPVTEIEEVHEPLSRLQLQRVECRRLGVPNAGGRLTILHSIAKALPAPDARLRKVEAVAVLIEPIEGMEDRLVEVVECLAPRQGDFAPDSPSPS